jgi:outer membrane protein assembly factor BamA
MGIRALAALLLSLAAVPGAAQTAPDQFAGRPVASVRVFIERQPTDDASLLGLIQTHPGEPLSLSDVRETIGHFYSLGRFQDIQADASLAPDGGVELTYTLVPLHAVERVDFTGELGLSGGLLRDTIRDRFGGSPPVGRAAEMTRVLERLYEDRGYFRSVIRASSRELHDPDRAVLTFEIDSGPRARIAAIDVVGDDAGLRDDLLRRLDVSPGDPYEREKVQQRLSDVAGRLKKRGRLQATVSHTARISTDGTAADLTIDLQAGPLVTVTFLGDPLPADEREALAPFQREGSVDEDLIEDSVQRIRDYLREQGYWKADVTVDPQRADGTLNVAFTVRKGPLYRVAADGVRITGNKAIRIEELRPLVVSLPGAPYVSSHLDATVGAIVRLYRTRGFAWADVKTSENELDAGGVGAGVIRPEIAIVEGPRAIITEVTIEGAAALSTAEVRRLMQLQPGTPYYEPTVRAARDAVQLEYLNLGFAAAQVAIDPQVSADRGSVHLAVKIGEGPQTLVDHLIVVGNTRTDEDVIRREIVLRPGAPLGLRDLLESRRRLSALGLFRRIDIRELEHGPSNRRDVLVTVQEALATTLGYGGGLEINRRLRAAGPEGEAQERLELAPRGFFDIGRRNLGGKNRSVNLFTRVSVRPKDAAADPQQDGRGFGFSEYRVVGTYREPRAFDWNADFTLTGAVEQGVRSSFNFARRGVTGELVRRLTPAIRTSARYSFNTTRTFDERLSEAEQARIDRLFPQVRLSMASGALVRDTRDDVADPTRGTFLSGEASVAARRLGGQVGFVKTYLQGYWFKLVPRSRRVVFATRLSVGLADGFAREAQPTDENGAPIEGPPEIIEDLPASERFFAGGDTTIRGYALDTVGTPKTISPRGFPRGGNGVLIMNAELRVPVWKDFGAAAFVDGGNVWERVTDMSLGELRGSVGFGLRYRSPIGPIRLDLGFKMDQREFEDRRTVLHFSMGQAF